MNGIFLLKSSKASTLILIPSSEATAGIWSITLVEDPIAKDAAIAS